MISPNISGGQLTKVITGWFYGMNTIRHPWQLRPDQYRRGVNISNRGGIIQTRNGFRMKLILPPGNLQGGEHFIVNKGTEKEKDFLVIAISGSVYALPFPLQQPRSWNQVKLQNIKFDENAKFVHFKSAEKSVETLTDSSLQIIPTYNVMVMQDGVNAAAFWDGEINRHLDESTPTLETPRGSWMEYSGGRLWIARGKVVIASDLRDPLKFVERTEGQSRGDFSFNKEVTGLKSFVDNDRNEVLTVFTEDRSNLLRSGIRNRTLWSTTDNFQSILFPSTGCVAGHSIVFQAGLMWWYSQGGLVASDSAASSFLTSQVNFKDAEMAFSKQFLADDLSGICGLSFENYLLMSMPVSQSLNSETFVLDYSTMSESTSEKIPSWASVWTGIRPTKWITAKIDGRQRAFALSVDCVSLNDGSHNHLWEAFDSERIDTFFELDTDFKTIEYKQPIFCEWESAALGDGVDLKRFEYAELDFREISGDVDVQVDYRGTRGSYKNIFCGKINSVTQYLNSGIKNFEDFRDEFGILRKQSRRLRTQDARIIPSAENCNCESDFNEQVDRYFSIVVRWCGQIALEAARVVMRIQTEQPQAGRNVTEEKICVIDELGASHTYTREEGFVPEDELYKKTSGQSWFSIQNFTETLTCGTGSITTPIQVTARATYRSRLSQVDADTQALAAAEQAAEARADYLRQLYPCYWDGFAEATKNCYGDPDAVIRAMGFQELTTDIVLVGEFTEDKTTPQNRLSARTIEGIRKLNLVTGTGFDAVVRDVVIDPDGLIYAGGNFIEYDGNPSRGIIRLLPDGQLDPSFQVGTGVNGSVLKMALDGDKIILAGSMTDYDGVSVDPGLIRINSDGSLDTSFTPPTDGVDAYNVVVQSDGKIMAVFSMSGGSSYKLRRLNSDGTIDSSFSEYTFATGYAGTGDVVVQDDGKVILAMGDIESNKNIARFDDDGTLDASFVAATNTNGIIRTVLLHSSGSIFIGGDFGTYNGTSINRIAKIENDGTLDATFRTNIGTSIGTGSTSRIFDIIELPNGDIAVSGFFSTFNGDNNGANKFIRLTQDGGYLPSFESVTESASARSTVSQSDADAAAQALADAKADAALPCT